MTTSIARRRWLAAALAASCVALPGCDAPKTYTKHPLSGDEQFDALLESQLVKDEPYDEAVSGFLITEDHAKLIVLGRPVHFVLDLPGSLRSALLSGYRESLRWTFADFRAMGGHLKGRYRVVLPRDASADTRQAAAADGFIDAQDGLALEGTIRGARYSTAGFDVPPGVAAQLLDRPYTIYARHVTTALSPLNLAMTATPITTTADGRLALAGTTLVAVDLVAIQTPRP
ncbi:hypothetical protein [Burkholderia stabilis]